MDNSSSSTPSPNSASATISRSNPFSIDYILSSSAAAAAAAGKQQPDNRALNQQLDFFNQQRAQLMAAAAAAAAQSGDPSAQQPIAMPPPVKLGQQPPPPNLLYFMACMLLQQQQQQQQQQQNHQNQQRQQQQAAAVAAAAAAANNQHMTRQPIDLARSPMDSLAILARLTGLPSNAPGSSPNGLGKHSRLMSNQTVRHQPYQTHQSDRSYPTPLPPPPPSSIMASLHHPLGALNNRQASDFLNQCRLSPMIGMKSIQQSSAGAAGKFGLNSNGSNTSPQQHSSSMIGGSNNLITSSSTNNNNTISCSSSSNTSHHGYGGPDKLDNLKPAHSYIGLIGMCILSSPEKRMVLNDIYQFILDNYPYYRNRGSGWRNSVRHNLSLNECFQKAGRAANGKGHYWTIHPANMEDFMLGDFRRRRAQRKVRRWNNMDVPSDESDDESMDDATKPPLPEHFKRSLEMHRQLELSYQKTVEATTAAAAFVAAGQSPLGTAPATSRPCSPLFRKHQDL